MLRWGLSLVAVPGGYSLLHWNGFSLQWLLLLSTGSRARRLSSCCTQAQKLWCPGLVTLPHVESFCTRDRTHVPCIGKQIPIHCTTRKVQDKDLYLLVHWYDPNSWKYPWHEIPYLVKVKVSQSCPTLCDSMDCIVHGILQARKLEWLAIHFSRESPQPRDRTQVSHTVGRLFSSWATREAQTEHMDKGVATLLDTLQYFPMAGGQSRLLHQHINSWPSDCLASSYFFNPPLWWVPPPCYSPNEVFE